MTDEKKKGKALNALKKKFNTGGRVNARRGGRRNNLSFSKEDLNTAQAKEFFRSTSKTAEPKKSTQEVKTSKPYFNPREQMGSNQATPKDLLSPKKATQTVKTSAPKKATQTAKTFAPKKATQEVKTSKPTLIKDIQL